MPCICRFETINRIRINLNKYLVKLDNCFKNTSISDIIHKRGQIETHSFYALNLEWKMYKLYMYLIEALFEI